MHVNNSTVAGSARRMLEEWFGWQIKSDLDFSRLAREGLDLDSVSVLAKLGYPNNDLAWIITQQTMTSRIRRKQKLTFEESVKVIRVARLTARAKLTFGDSKKAIRWLRKSKTELGGMTPLQAMQDEFGARAVRELLERVDSGFY